ncbi:RecF/RecN/SMC N terminal domain-containing protein [Colletotrichum tofieldiae]|nr:RecF/RecN/SMC N terminal domain-containing protein [Colletotrichum tofieldiae]GKT90038.1 recF/recN/SMC N terminal domain-containing protein [Colletotrichum tofieldiae]
MSARPRRATRRQAIVDSSDDDDEIANVTKRESSEEEFAPEPSKSPVRRPTRARKSAAPASVPATTAPRRRGRPKKNAEPAPSEAPSTLEASSILEEPSTVDGPSAVEGTSVAEEPSGVEEPSTLEAPTTLDVAPSIEPSEIFDPDQTVTKSEPQSSPRISSPKKPRKSAAPRASTKSSTPSSIPTPKPSATPEPSRPQAEPLADITASTVNEQRPVPDDTQANFKPVRAMDTVLEKPMDIVLKSRNLTIPVVEDTAPKPRLVISYLILTNFKSYAGRQEVGPFHGSFSSVVGPNGSGKSNVIDSLLFVFGFRASKMRQGKLSALIHNSAQHPNLDHCEVSVHFREVMDQNKALAYLRDENELTIKKSALYQLYIGECNDNVAVTEEAISQMQAQLDDELEKHHGSEKVIKELQKSYSRGSKEFETEAKETEALVKEMAKFEQERVKFDEKKKFLNDKQKKLEKAIANAEKSTVEADETIVQCTEEIEDRAKEIASLEIRVQEEEAELATIRESLKGKTQKFSDQIAVKQKSLEPWKEKINQKQSAIAVAQSEMNILEEKANAGAVAISETEAKIAAIEDARTAKAEELKECQAEKAKLEEEAKEVEHELSRFNAHEPKIRAKVSNARQKADEARSSLSKTQTQGNVLTALMRMRESGRIDGFHGRLGNLGAIDQKYDVAISTACGALDNFVTDTVEAGQQCIEYLRKTNLGRGNFMCLDKLRVRDMKPIQTPENAPRLFDLVTPKEERFRPAFYHALQDTLVANDLAQANRIAYGAKRWRVVTLAGELIDKSGTMSGGGSTVKRGLMSSKLVAETSKDQVTKLEQDRDVLEDKYNDFQEQQRELEARLRELHEQIPMLDTKMQKITLEIESAARNLADAHRRIKELSKEHQPSATDDNRIAALRKEIAKLNKEVEKLHDETSGVEEEIKALQDKIMEVGGEKLRLQRANVDSLKEEIVSQNEETSNAEVRKVKAEKQKTKLERDHAKATKEIEAAIRDLEKLDHEIENQGEKAESLQAQVDEAEEGLAAKKRELSSLKAELDDKTSELNATRAVEIEMRNKLEENQKVLAENQKRLMYWNDKLSKLTLQNVEDLTGTSNPALKHTPAPAPSAVGQRDAAKKRCDELRRLRLEGFMEGFSTISLRLKEMYQMITMGGNAELELVDSLDPFSEGILFSVMPPKKSWKNISHLSGGEKTLSSLALVFALHHYKPTPLYVMDEIDAALDFRNVSIVANYIKERTKNAQFIVISLRNNMFELAARLVGVYKVNHMTKSVTIENQDYIVRRGQQGQTQAATQQTTMAR